MGNDPYEGSYEVGGWNWYRNRHITGNDTYDANKVETMVIVKVPETGCEEAGTVGFHMGLADHKVIAMKLTGNALTFKDQNGHGGEEAMELARNYRDMGYEEIEGDPTDLKTIVEVL